MSQAQAALAALTELEQQLAAADHGKRSLLHQKDVLESRAVAAEANRDRLQAELDDALDELNEARAALTTPDTPRELDRAGIVPLAPDTPPQHNHRTRVIKPPGVCPKCDANRATPDTPPDA